MSGAPDQLVLIALLLPAASFLALALLVPLRRSGRGGAFFSIAAALGAFVSAVMAWRAFDTVGAAAVRTWTWLPEQQGALATVGVLADGQSTVMLLLVTLVALLVQIYSLGYLADEPPAALGRYLWAEAPPNNWRSVFTGKSAWVPRDGRYYLAHFTPQQPDLDWWNPAVREEFDRILRFWLERGVGGFRIDVAHSIVKDRLLRDNTPAKPGDPEWVQRMGSWNDRGMNQPETHEVLAHWREIVDEYGETALFGETYVDLERLPLFYGNGHDELSLAHNVNFMKSRLDASELRPIVEQVEATLPEGSWPTYSGSNHDDLRFATRWAEGDERKALAALAMLLGLRGTPFLYMGDELALENGEVPPERLLDPARPARDPGRTPMPWTREGKEWREPWLPVSDTSRNVEEQMADPGSTLNFVRETIQARPAWAAEPYETLPADDGVWAWSRGDTTFALNLSDEDAAFGGRSLEPWAAARL